MIITVRLWKKSQLKKLKNSDSDFEEIVEYLANKNPEFKMEYEYIENTKVYKRMIRNDEVINIKHYVENGYYILYQENQ